MALIPVYTSVEEYQSQAANTNIVPPNAAYPASLLISRAWNLSGIVARDFETEMGSEGADGLFLLNELLEYKACDLKLIPYFQRVEFNLVQGQERYYIPNLYQIETFTFNIGEVRFPTFSASRTQYFGDGRVDNIQALPFEWHLERTWGGSYFYVYFLPQQQYLGKISGKFALTNVELQTNLAEFYDGFYISYLRYALANFMSLEYDITFAEDKAKMMRQMEQKLIYVSPPDLSVRKISFMNSNAPFSWAHANISPAWNVS
jgi:hypothetical protein